MNRGPVAARRLLSSAADASEQSLSTAATSIVAPTSARGPAPEDAERFRMMTVRTSEVSRDPDEALVERARAGDRVAFGILVARHRSAILRVARQFLRNDSDAEEIAQDVFLAALCALSSFRGNARFATWLHRMVRNAALRRLQLVQRYDLKSFTELRVIHDRDTHRSGASPADRLVEANEVTERVANAIARLSDRHRAVLILRVVQGLSTAEAAYALSASRLAVRARLSRARHVVRQMVDGGRPLSDARV